MSSDRDKEICQLYTAGLTLRQVGDRFGLSRERVRQILRESQVYKGSRDKVSRSVRDKFLGINISEGDKAALCQEALRRGISMSALTAELIREMLAGLPQETV